MIHITFGKHKGKPISTIPLDYLQWMVEKKTVQYDDAEAEIYRRETGQSKTADKTATISLYAIDAASMSLQHLWIPTGQGVATWLFDEFTAALNNSPLKTSTLTAGKYVIEHKGIKFSLDADLQLIDVYPLEEAMQCLA